MTLLSRFFPAVFLTFLFASSCMAQQATNKAVTPASPAAKASTLQEAFAPAPPKNKQPQLECRYLFLIENGFLAYHVKTEKRDVELEKRVIEQYIKRLDPTKFYLLQSDVEEIRRELKDIFAQIKGRNCSPLNRVQARLHQRVRERAEFAKKFLGPKYKFDEKVEFLFDPDKMEYPKTSAEAEAFLQKYIHFQISNYLATDMKMAEAKENVTKNWARQVRRTTEMTLNDLYAGYLDSFGRALDPHSSYLAPETNEDFKMGMSLTLEGIGATLSSQDGFTVIESLATGGPAAKSGLLEPKDKIVAVGQATGPMENVIEMDLSDVVRKIRGPKGTKVRLSLLRKKGDGKERLEITLVRDKINLEDQAAQIHYQNIKAGGKDRKVGIINLPSFYSDGKRGGRSAANDLRKLIAEAKKQNVEGIVLDFSSNGGGSLDDAVRISGLFFGEGNVVKQATREDPKGLRTTLRDSDPAVDWAGPLVILTSRISASASEIVAGALRDYQRAVIVGADHTFGKGTVQTLADIPPQSGEFGAIKVTVGTFFVAGGKSTQHRGVEAHVVIPGRFDGDEVGEKSLDYSLPPAELPPFLSPEAYVTKGDGAWRRITDVEIKSLAEKSKARVTKSEEFKKIIEENEKMEKTGKMIRLSDVMKDKDKKEKAREDRYKSQDEKAKDYVKRPEIMESVAVLADLLEMQAAKP